MPPSKNVISFVVRFVQGIESVPGSTGGSGAGWRGLVRHIQSGEEVHFLRLEEVTEFMRRFVPVNEPPRQAERGEKG